MRVGTSCNRLAASDLVVSCQSLSTREEVSKPDSRVLDTVKSLFAARLALCELEDAGASIPDECAPISTHQHHSHDQNPRNTMRIVLEPCLRLLESKPQWWTSYSNNRQNAGIMCEAARIEIQKEEQLVDYQQLANVTHLIAQLLGETYIKAEYEKKKQEEFMTSIDNSREAMVTSFFKDTMSMKMIMEELLKDLETSKTSLEEGEADISDLTRDMKTSASTAKRLSEDLNEIHKWISQQQDKLARAEQEKQEYSLTALSALQSRLDDLSSRDIDSVVNLIDMIMLNLSMMGEAVRTITQHHNELDLRFGKTFNELETIADSFQRRQLQHLHDQAAMHQSFQNELAANRDMLMDIEISAHGLKESIDGAKETLSSFVHLGNVVGSLYKVTWIIAVAVLIRHLRTSKYIICVSFMIIGESIALEVRRLRSGLTMCTVLFYTLVNGYEHLDAVNDTAILLIIAVMSTTSHTLWLAGGMLLAVAGLIGYVLTRRQKARSHELPVSVQTCEKATTASENA
ncbi:hypothetical protein KEM54_000970 [Ascosphaera aggregata]|nr:hypothetical protein KEM54_000970 [Ascosphaera aggregata]